MKRTDLAMEIHGFLSAEESVSSLPGVRAETKQRGSIRTTVVQVLDEQGARRMGKARGTYLSMELQDTDAQTRAEAAAQLAGHLGKLLPARGAVTVVGLGNRAVTADALGARSVDRLLITAHLAGQFPRLRSVSAFCPGVKGRTGLESLELVRAVTARAGSACVIAVDALAAAELSHIGTVIQLSDAGIQPGSGVGNRRDGLDRKSLGVPVLALGVPTVTDPDESGLGRAVTTADIDASVASMACLLADALNRALQPGLSQRELEDFVR